MPFPSGLNAAFLSGADWSPSRIGGTSADLSTPRIGGTWADWSTPRIGGPFAELSTPRIGGTWADWSPERIGGGRNGGPLHNICPAAPHDMPSTRSPWPWLSVDAPWTYSSADALLAQAVRKTRTKILRTGDDPHAIPALVAPAASKKTREKLNALWRWQSPFRVKTVVAELMGRFGVGNGSVYRLVQTSTTTLAAPTLAVESVFDLGNPPPVVKLNEQIDKVLRAAVEREDRLPEILSQMDDMGPFFDTICGLQMSQVPAVAELLTVAHEWALHIIMMLKHGVQADRPWQCSALVMPAIPTPGHGSLPSGHAALAAMVSELLMALLYEPKFFSIRARRRAPGAQNLSTHPRAEQLDRLARRIAFNRVVAGLHFPIDSQVGYQLGTQLGRLLVAAAGQGDQPQAVLAADVFASIELPEVGTRPAFKAAVGAVQEAAPNWQELWRVASGQLAQLRV